MPRVIRKLDLAGQPTFDEQLWPINALLVVLCALAAGVIVGTSQFNDEISWSNGWVRLATLVGSVGLLMLLAWKFRGKIGRRFQLGAVASLVLHALVGILLHWQHLHFLQDNPQVAQRENTPVLVQYEYHIRAPDEQVPREAHERPVVTVTPENRPIDLTRIPPEERPVEEPQPQPVPETQRSVEPTRMQMKRNELAAPKREDQESLHSRSTTLTPTQPSERISAPEQRAAADTATETPQVSPTTVTRTETAASSQRPTTQAAVEVQATRDAAQPTRRTANESQRPSPATSNSSISRSIAAPVETTPLAETATANPSRAEPNDSAQVPNNVEVARRETASPMSRSNVAAAEPTISATPPATAPPSPRSVTASQPSVSSSDSQAASRALAQASASTAPAEQPAAQSSPTAVATPRLTGPAESDLARTTAAQPNQAVLQQNDAPASTAASVVSAATARHEPAATPSVERAGAASNSPARALTSAANAASPTNLDSPAVAATRSAESSAQQQPAATSVSRSTTGSAGAGQSPNFDRGLPSPSAPATIASAASQRVASTIDSGAAPAASAPAALRRSRAQAAIDSTTALAQDAGPADYRGGPTATQVEASSSAAVERRASTAPQGRIAADAGNLPADTGAQQVVSPRGLARSAGGGQPTVAAALSSGQPGRTTASGEAVAALSTNIVAPAVSAAEGGRAASPTALPAAQDGSVARPEAGAPVAPSFAGAQSTASGGSQSVARAASDGRVRTSTGNPVVTGLTAAPPGRRTAETSMGDLTAAEVQPTVAAQTSTSGEPLPSPNQVATDGPNPSSAVSRVSPVPGGRPAGASAADVAANATPTAVDGRRASEDSNISGPEIQQSIRGAPARSARAAIASANEAIAAPALLGNQPTAVADNAGDSQPGPATGPNSVERQSTGGVPVEIASIAGPGGLASELSAIVGSRKSAAQRDSELIHDTDTRFLGREISGAVPEPSFIREAAKAFERRGRDNGTGQGQQGAKTEEAVERGLEFLARAQQSDGSWSIQSFPGATDDDRGMIQSDSAATGLALMAFLGGGYDHFEDKHRDTVRRGLDFLLHQQSDEGDLYVAQDPKSHESAWLYSHAIASIALCEALGMTGDEELRGPAQRALDFIQAAQDRQFGGWRYEPGAGSDTSVAGWQLMALKSGELAGLKISSETYDGVRKWLDRAQANNDGSQYLYNPTRPNTQYPTDQRRPTMTSVGLLMRLYLGWNRGRPEMKRGAEHILKYPAAYGTASTPMRDTYYWYYATQVMFHMRGDYWREWNGKLYPLLINSQIQQGPSAGSWHPGGNIPDRWGPQGGRIYVTTMNLLSLEVYYRHLPIYEETAK